MEYYEHKLDPVGVRPDWLGDGDKIGFKPNTRDWTRYNDWSPDECGLRWHEITAIRIPAEHWAVPALKAGFVPWQGGETAPTDWDRGEVLLRDGRIVDFDDDWQDWKRTGSTMDIIGYRRKPAELPVRDPALVERMERVVLEFGGEEYTHNFGPIWTEVRRLAAELEPGPVDPLVEVLDSAPGWTGEDAYLLRAELAKRGLEITPTGKAPK